MNPVLLPAYGALLVLAFDLLARPGPRADRGARDAALSGIRLGSVALATLAGVVFLLRRGHRGPAEGLLSVDAFGVLGIVSIVAGGILVLSLSLTHFGMERSRPAEPLALLLFAWSGSLAAIVTQNLVALMVALELAWLPVVALIAIDSRRLSSSESSLKAFFAHALASLVFAQGVAMLFGATGALDMSALAHGSAESETAAGGPTLLFSVGATLVLLGVMARAVIAPFHPWSPDVYEGAPSFVTTHVATVAQLTSFFVLLRLLHAVAPPAGDEFAARIPTLFGWLGVIGLLWGHAMALVQVGLRRLVGWLGVGQAGFFTLALVDARGAGGEALVWALFASAIAIAGIMATLSSLSHHERACENVGDLSGMMQTSPIRAALLALFLLSLGGLPGTVGFVARFRILAALEHAGHREWMLAGLVATVLALSAVGRPLLAMLRPVDDRREGSRALTNEQFVLAICGATVFFFGWAPMLGESSISEPVSAWIAGAVSSLRE